MFEDIFRQVPASRTEIHALRKQAIRQSAHRTWCFAEELCRLGLTTAARAQIKGAVKIRPAMLLSGRAWALWAASYFGYAWFERMHSWKQRIAPKHAAPTFNSKQL
jgi:hypothetical protein